jgi:hypothetical protein
VRVQTNAVTPREFRASFIKSSVTENVEQAEHYLSHGKIGRVEIPFDASLLSRKISSVF